MLPGRACGMPYAPEELLRARWFQPLSLFHSLSRHGNWSSPKPRCQHQRAAGLAVAGELVARRRDRAGVRHRRLAAAAGAAASLGLLADGRLVDPAGLLRRLLGLGGGLRVAASRCAARCREVATMRAAARSLSICASARWPSVATPAVEPSLLGFPVLAQIHAAGNSHERAVRRTASGHRTGSTADSRSVPFVGDRTRRTTPGPAMSGPVPRPSARPLPVTSVHRTADATATDRRSGRSQDTIAHREPERNPTAQVDVTCGHAAYRVNTGQASGGT